MLVKRPNSDAPWLLCSRREADNLDFSQGMRGWTSQNVSSALLDTHITRNGKPTLALTLQQEKAMGRVGILSYQSFRADTYRRKRVRATAYLRADGVPQPIFSMGLEGPFSFPTGLSTEDRPSYTTDSETMQIVDTQVWMPHALVMDIPQETLTISFDFRMREQGNGTIWLDGIEFETVDEGVPLTDTHVGSRPLQPFNLDFSHGLLFWDVKGEAVWHYERGIDTSAAPDSSPCAFVRSTSADLASRCTLQQVVSAQHYQGKSIRLHATIKTVSARRVHFFVKRRFPNGESCEEIISGTTDWTVYRLTLPITVGSSDFVFGVTLDGTGQFWLKNVQFQMEEGVF